MRQQDVKTNAEYIKRMMKRFKLVDMREQYQDLILEAESSSMDYETFLVRLLAVEEEGKSSLIITTNLPMGRWDEMFTGRLAATVILDRLVHHCHILSITGDSYRVKGSKQSVKGKVQKT